jgi:hypothetical protein
MDVVPGTSDWREGYDEINKTRDYIAGRTSAIQPVAKGGTGAATAEGARTNLDVPSTDDLATGLAGKSNTNHTHQYGAITPGVIDNGGFGASLGQTHIVAGLTVDGAAYIAGRLTSPTARNSGVTSWNSLGVDPSGNIGVQTSSRRFKKDIKTWTPAAQAVYAMRLVEYRYKAAVEANSPVEHGVIAEELIELGLDWLVFFDDDGQPFGVHYERIALACVAAIHDLDARLTRLENDHA